MKKDPLTAGTSSYSWKEGGKITLDFLIDHGLKPQHNLLDLGCGTLPLANHAIPYLTSGIYSCMDISKQGILAGKELIGPDKFSEIIWIQNTNLKFDEMYFRLCERFDYIIALSVFNHNPIDNFEEFIENVHKIITNNTQIFLTYLEFSNNKTHIRIPDNICGEKRDNWEGYRGVDFPYSFNDVQKICTKNGFTVTKIDMSKKYWKKIPLPLLKMIKII